ncbi:hypothetical protein ACQ4PT_063158 [Festuca glaucescens]
MAAIYAAAAGLVLLLHILVAVVTAGNDPLLLACGAAGPITLPDGRVFLPDSNISISPAHASRTTTATAASSPLYSTARVFSADATYSLPVPRSPHRHLLLRLHLLQSAQFAVATGDLQLISDSRAASPAAWGRYNYREYLLPHRAGGLLHLRFSPRPGSIALLNAVELFPAPNSLLPLSLNPPGVLRLAETFYRVNAGAHGAASSLNDSFSRLWESDAAYLLNAAAARSVSVDPASVRYPQGAVPPYAAPAAVYAQAQEMADARVGNQRFNLSWAFPVDPGFRYSVRLHFCDIVGRNSTDLVFEVYLNNDTVLSNFDLSGKLGLFDAYFLDFVVAVPPGLERILLQVGPPRVSYSQPNAILNGVEIMKLGDQQTVRRVDALAATQPGLKAQEKKVAVISAVTGSGAMLIICIVGMLLFLRRRRKGKEKRLSLRRQPSSSIGLDTHTGISASKVSAARSCPSSGPSLGISQIMQATNNFDESLVIGVGGFGKVYKGVLWNDTVVAVKRGNPRSQQGLLEFRTEIEMLSKLRHRHLVSLIWYCHEAGEMALVYEFMAGGPLREHLPAINPALPREQVNIVDWAMKWQKLGQLERLMDPRLVGSVSIGSLRKFGETAQKCLAEYGVDRPTMGDVLWNLECALQQQESFLRSAGEASSSGTNGAQGFLGWTCRAGGDAMDEGCSIVGGVTDTTVGTTVFSQILDPRGR